MSNTTSQSTNDSSSADAVSVAVAIETIAMTTSDKEIIEVEKVTFDQMKGTSGIYYMCLEQDPDDKEVDLDEVSSKALRLMIEQDQLFREKTDPNADRFDPDRADLGDDVYVKVEQWDCDWFRAHCEDFNEMLNAADNVGFEHLINHMTQHLANELEGKTVEQMREILGVECDLTEEELAQIDEEYSWIQPEKNNN